MKVVCRISDEGKGHRAWTAVGRGVKRRPTFDRTFKLDKEFRHLSVHEGDLIIRHQPVNEVREVGSDGPGWQRIAVSRVGGGEEEKKK